MEYFEELKERVDECYNIASSVRYKGLDPVDNVECKIALTMAERAVNLVCVIYKNLNVDRISSRILELEEKFGKLSNNVVFNIALEVARGDFGDFGGVLENIDCGLRIGFAYMTLGVVVSPIEGYTGLKLMNKNIKQVNEKDIKDFKKRSDYYFVVNFSGPIRSAGTTATVLFLMLVDFLREEFGFGKYEASNYEIERYVLEIREYHEKVTNLAYFPTEEEIRFLAARIPIQISGESTERLEVSSFRDLERIETNRIRGGMCLAFGESLALKAEKGWGRLRDLKNSGLNYNGWDWIVEYIDLHSKRSSGTVDVDAMYINNIVAGRPVFGHPGLSGVFRFRYGRSRTNGFSSASIHPATMGISGGFLAHGTQLRLEKPIKACIVTGCDSIEGPIVRLKDGSVEKLSDYENARKKYDSGEIEEVLYLGDILFTVGDIVDRNVDLIRPGYVEEWWENELSKLGKQQDMDSSFESLISVSERYGIALHPSLIFYWSQITTKEFIDLVRWVNGSEIRGDKLVLNWEASNRDKFKVAKRALEKLGVLHQVVLDNVVIDSDAKTFLLNLGKRGFYNGEVLEFRINETDSRSVLEIVNDWCEFEIRDKWGTGIGSRMGRPEKAKLRKLTGSPNVLFPVGDQGGRMKSIGSVVEKGFVKGEFGMFSCECGKMNIYRKCECGQIGKQVGFCYGCNEIKDKVCKIHGDLSWYWNQKVDIKEYFDNASLNIGEKVNDIKGVVKLNNKDKALENLTKGFLRAKHGLSVNKDGTVRYDATEVCLTHFKPQEIDIDYSRLRELGYLYDVDGKELISNCQILELKPHDIVLPDISVLGDERCGVTMKRICDFLDDELVKLYGLEKFYNVKNRDDFVGQLVVCMAPHNCAGVVGRVIGWSKIQGVLASPFMHAAMRRDCDGDECSVMLLMDVLVNFSRKFLPDHRGASQDAPLILNVKICVGEVDDQILFFDGMGRYPLEFYNLASSGTHSSEVKGIVDLVGDKLRCGEDGFFGNGFGFDSVDFNNGNNVSIYKSLPTMKEKVAAQMELVKKLRGVDENDVARLILEKHFIRDIRGNLRKFCKQEFRCLGCGEKFRRPPLIGECWKCGGRLIGTVSEGSVRKYLELARELVSDYDISSYISENMELIGDFIERVFGSEKQEKLS